MPARTALQLLGPDGSCHHPAQQTCDYKQGKASHESILAKGALWRKIGSAFGKLGSAFYRMTKIS